jgi:hypothetical protein
MVYTVDFNHNASPVGQKEEKVHPLSRKAFAVAKARHDCRIVMEIDLRYQRR